MAWTMTKKFHCAMGNVFAAGYDVTSDSATLEFQTPFKSVLSVVSAKQSMNSLGVTLRLNQNSTGVAAQGYVAITGSTSGDAFYLVVYGR